MFFHVFSNYFGLCVFCALFICFLCVCVIYRNSTNIQCVVMYFVVFVRFCVFVMFVRAFVEFCLSCCCLFAIWRIARKRERAPLRITEMDIKILKICLIVFIPNIALYTLQRNAAQPGSKAPWHTMSNTQQAIGSKLYHKCVGNLT